MPFTYCLPDALGVVAVVALDYPRVVSGVRSKHQGGVHKLAVGLVVDDSRFTGVIW